MTLATGDRLGSYEVLELIGAGGMGEVHRARDTRLHRDVALKVLPEARRLDTEALQRFEREARLLASLNHPNIATLHGGPAMRCKTSVSGSRRPFRGGSLALLALAMAMPAAGQAPAFDAADYALLPDIRQSELSPDGALLAMLFAAENDGSSLNLYDVHGRSEPISVFDLGRDLTLDWLSWSGAGWLVARTTELRLSRFGDTYGVPGLMALQPGIDGAYPLTLVTDEGEWHPLDLVDALPEYPEHVLITAYPPAGSGPVLITLNMTHPSLMPERIVEQRVLTGSRIPETDRAPDRMITPTSVPDHGQGRVMQWYHDAAGRLRMIRVLEGDAVRILALGPDRTHWVMLHERSIHDAAIFEPLVFDAKDDDLLYVVSKHTGDALGLYSYRMSSSELVREFFAQQHPDMFEVIFDRARKRIEGIRFADGPDGVHWLNEELAGVIAELRRLLPDGDLNLVSHDEGYGTFVLQQSSIDFPPKLHLYRKAARSLDELGPVYPKLAPIPVETQHQSIAASTGQRVLLDVLQPLVADGTPAERRPTIVVAANGPRNGPLRFQPTIHRLVRSGYNVALVRTVSDLYFRVDDTYPWNPVSTEALEAAVDWLAENGIGDPALTCLLGGDDSALSLLQAAGRRDYACVVLEDPLVDFDDLERSNSRYFDLALSRARRAIPEQPRTLASRESRESAFKPTVFVGYPAGRSSIPPSQHQSLRRDLRRAWVRHKVVEYYAPRLDERIEYIRGMDEFLAAYLRGFRAMMRSRPEQ